MSLRKTIFVMVVVIVSLVSIATASAAGRDYVFSVVPQTQFVAPGENALVNYSATNNTDAAVPCTLYVVETGFTHIIGTIGSGQTAGGQLSTPVNEKNGKLTFQLICNGIIVAKDTSNVKLVR